MPPQHSSVWLSSAQLGIFILHRSAQLSSAQHGMVRHSSAQLGSACHDLARCSYRAELPGWKQQCLVGGCVPCLQSKPRPVPPAPTCRWDSGSTGHSIPQGYPTIVVSLDRMVPQTCSSAGEAPYGHHMATFHPGPSVVSSHAPISTFAGSRLVRCESLPICSLQCRANNPWVISNHFSASSCSFSTRSGQRMSAPGFPWLVP